MVTQRRKPWADPRAIPSASVLPLGRELREDWFPMVKIENIAQAHGAL